MSGLVLVVTLLMLADQPPTVTSLPVAQATTAAKPAEPKMICKYEFATGSRLNKVKVCRPTDEPDGPTTAMERAFQKHDDYIVPQGGDIITGRSGLNSGH